MSRICFVGLGNPGAKYRGTRHNIGFEWVEALAASSLFSGRVKVAEKFQSFWGMASFESHEVHFLLPQTFMNESGKALRAWADKYQGESRSVVIFDDMDIALGKMRYREDGSDGGHRGLRSVIEHMGTDNIPRLRLGIGRPVDATVDHVLSKFTPDERGVANKLLADVEWQFKTLLEDNIEKVMNQLNGKNYGT